MTEATKFQLLFQNERLQSISYEELLIFRWTAAGTADELRRMVQTQRSFLQQHGTTRTAAMTHLRMKSLTPPDEQERALIREHQALIASAVCVSLLLIEINPFAAAIVHGVASASGAIPQKNKAPFVSSYTALDTFSAFDKYRDKTRPRETPDTIARSYEAFQRTLLYS